MSFLDKKEREIDIKLTPHGKRLYSEGKLHPFYYRFFDDDILYDASYAGIEENQEDAESRITNDTPRLSTQVTFKSREESLNYQSLDVDNLSIEDQEEVFGKIESALGNSGIGNQSASNLYSRVYNHKFESNLN